MSERTPAERLADLRSRAAARRATLPPYTPDPEGDARLSAESAPFRDAQWETAAWSGEDVP